MNTLKILNLVGGISHRSLNKKIAKAMQAQAPQGHQLIQYDISRLPYFSQDIENEPPLVVEEYKELIRDSDALLVITPEYNRSFPGVLKNALDWGSRPYGQNLWNQMPAGVLGASPGKIGTFGAQHHLRQVFTYLNMKTMSSPEFYCQAHENAFDQDDHLIDLGIQHLVDEYWSHFSDWIQAHRLRHSVNLSVPTFPSQGQEDAQISQ